MIHECEYIYETGRKCRRIPKRGESLCPGHRPHGKRSVHDEPDFQRQIAAFIDQLRAADTLSLVCCLQDALRAIQPTIERKSSRAAYVPFARAVVVVAIAIERFSATPAPAHAAQHAPFAIRSMRTAPPAAQPQPFQNKMTAR